MATDLAAKRRRVMREDSTRVAPVGAEPHPQRRAAQYHAELTQIWNGSEQLGDCPPEVEEWLDEARMACAAPHLSAARLRRAASATAGTAAGPDGWQGDALRRLPETFWIAAAQLWATLLSTGTIPAAFMQNRTVGIPKSDGGVRPLGIEVVMWRCGVALMTKELGRWAEACAAERLVVAIRATSPDAFHEALTADLEDASRPGGAPLMGSKLDIRKCFDTVDTGIANRLLRRLGAPSEVIDLMARFDALQERFVEADGAVDPTPIRPSR